MKKFRWLEWVKENPIESVLFVFSLALVASAIWIIGPWYLASGGATPIQVAIVRRVAEMGIGAILLLGGLPGLIAPFLRRPLRWLKIGSMAVFLCFLFLTILRLLVIGPVPIIWVPLLAISLAAGAIRLHVGTRQI